MEGRRRFWGAVALAALLIGLAVLLARPLLLAGSTLILGWLLAKAAVFQRRITALDTALKVSQSVSPTSVVTEEAGHGTLQAAITDPLDLLVSITVDLPPSIRHRDGDTSITLDPTTREAEAAFSFEPLVAGRVELSRPQHEITDPDVLFRETLSRGPSTTLQVEPSAPHDLHIGTGGDEVAATYGDHESERLGAGIEPAEIREYVPGDAAKRIDWKATARLGEAYVREFEAETDRSLLILFDHGPSLGTGPPGRTELDYLREAALGIVTTAQRVNDPIALFTCSDRDLAGQHRPGATNTVYESARMRLHDLGPVDGQVDDPDHTDRPGIAEVREQARLLDDTTPFGATLSPYLDRTDVFVERLDDSPLFHAARRAHETVRTKAWTVILTDDRNRSRIRETVRLASRRGGWVLVFIAPTVLYEPTEMDRIEDAYERYRAFEDFRQEISRLPRVEAFEVAPGDRLDAILSAHRAARGVA